MPDETTGLPTSYGPADTEDLLKKYRAEMIAAGGLFGGSDDDAPDDDDEESDDADDTASEVTSEESTDSDDDDVDDSTDGSDDDAADDDESAEDSAQGQEDDDSETAVTDKKTASPKQKTRRGGTLKRVKAKLDETEKELAELKAGQDERDNKVLERFRSEQKDSEKIQLQGAAREAELTEMNKVVNEWVGSDDDVAELITKVENGDPLAASRLREVRAARRTLKTVTTWAENETQRRMGLVYAKATAGIDNVDAAVIADAHLPTVIKHLHEAGVVTGQAKNQAEIDRLTALIAEKDTEIETLNDKLTGTTSRAIGKTRREPVVSGGRSVKPRSKDAELDDLYGEDGNFRDGFDPFAAVRSAKVKFF